MSESDDPMVSHGRGGQANIGPDHTAYVPGEIVREGPEGDQGDGAYSAGRGGAGNIGSPRTEPTHHGSDADVVPDSATRLEMNESHHTGRGGGGNVHHHHEKEGVESSANHEGLAEKLKHKILGEKK